MWQEWMAVSVCVFHLQRCPVCGVMCEKVAGCNFMTCEVRWVGQGVDGHHGVNLLILCLSVPACSRSSARPRGFISATSAANSSHGLTYVAIDHTHHDAHTLVMSPIIFLLSFLSTTPISVFTAPLATAALTCQIPSKVGIHTTAHTHTAWSARLLMVAVFPPLVQPVRTSIPMCVSWVSTRHAHTVPTGVARLRQQLPRQPEDQDQRQPPSNMPNSSAP